MSFYKALTDSDVINIKSDNNVTVLNLSYSSDISKYKYLSSSHKIPSQSTRYIKINYRYLAKLDVNVVQNIPWKSVPYSLITYYQDLSDGLP